MYMNEATVIHSVDCGGVNKNGDGVEERTVINWERKERVFRTNV